MSYTRGPGPLQSEHEQLKSDIGIVEDGNAAVHAIAEGQYVIWKGNLYVANIDIAIGTTLSAESNGNLTEKTKGLGEDVAKINNKISTIIPQKVIVDDTSETVRNYHIPNKARCFIVGSAGLSANHFCIIINSHPSNGTISKAEVYKGSNVTITTDTNKLIVTTGSTDLSLFVFVQNETKIDDIYLMS